MKRKILLWLASLRHKPKWLQKKIDMMYWADIADARERKEIHLSKHMKKLCEFEKTVIEHINSLRLSMLHGYSDKSLKFKKLSDQEAMNRIITRMRQERDKPTDEEIYTRLKHLGFHPPEALNPEVKERVWQDLATKKQYIVDRESEKKIDTKKIIPVSEDSLKIIKKEAKKKITKLTRSKPNGKSKTTK
jgi:hypothetical protein